MSLRNLSLWDKGDVASIYEETLSDGAHVYNIRVYDSRDDSNYAEIEVFDEKHAAKIFDLLNGGTK